MLFKLYFIIIKTKNDYVSVIGRLTATNINQQLKQVVQSNV